MNAVLPARRRRPVGSDAIAARGRLGAMRWLVARRVTQLAVLALFLAGPWFGVWIARGDLAASRILDMIPMTDPLVIAQSLAAGHWPRSSAWIGAAIVVALYALVGGRSYCAWVCPMNAVTDGAGWLRRRLGLRAGVTLPRTIRHWLLPALLAASAATGTLAWEFVNPVSILGRGLVFGLGMGASVIVALVFLFDLLVTPRGFCGHVCPMGAAYGLIGRICITRVAATRREACTDCGDCLQVCPEPQVIKPALKGVHGSSPVILSGDCTNCGRCIDICAPQVFRFTHRSDRRTSS